MPFQFRRFREAVILAVDTSSRTIDDLTLQRTMPLSLMVVQLIFSRQVDVLPRLTVRFGAKYRLSMRGFVVSSDHILGTERCNCAARKGAVVALLVDITNMLQPV